MNKSIRNTLLAAAAIGGLSQAALAQTASTAQPAKNVVPVSYTHLDVYKRQLPNSTHKDGKDVS